MTLSPSRSLSNVGVVLVLAAVMLPSDITVGTQAHTNPPKSVQAMPMSRLISEPKLYNGVVVSTVGVLSVQEEECALYLDVGSYEHAVELNGLHLDVCDGSIEEISGWSGQYVVVSGTFRFDKGLYGKETFHGAITDALRIHRLARR